MKLLVVREVEKVKHAPHPTALCRGKATIPLNGIDVPFHSSHLQGSVPTFREYLQQLIRVETLDPARLTGKYVPNLTGRLFDVSRENFEEVWRVTRSMRARRVLDVVSLATFLKVQAAVPNFRMLLYKS